MTSISGKEANRNRLILILVLIMFFALFIINVFIRKSLNETVSSPGESPESAGTSIVVPQGEKIQKSAVLMQAEKNNSPVLPKASSNSASKQDKEIIYEPSIKGDILLQ